jgi:AraC family transcriptional regulator
MIRCVRAATSDGLSVREVQYDHGVTMGRHAHRELSLTMVLSGALRECVGSKGRAEPAAFAIGVKPFGVEHANAFAPTGTRLISVTVTKSWYDRLEEPVPALDDWRWVGGGPAVATFLHLLQHLRQDSTAEGAWLEASVIDLMAAFGADARLGRTGHPPVWLSHVRQRLFEEARPGVRTTTLAQEAGVHPVSLARAFRRHYGESISDCVRRARFLRAARLLSETRLPLPAVALEAGLADQSHLSRLCRRETGVTPAALRRLQTKVSIVQERRKPEH